MIAPRSGNEGGAILNLEMTPSDTSQGRTHGSLRPELSRIAPAVGGCVEAFVLLGGGLTPSPLTAAAQCSVLDLLVGPGDRTVLSRWLERIDGLGDLAADRLSVIVANGEDIPAPRLPAEASRQIEVVVDRENYRGAAGVVHDVSQHLSGDAVLLVAEAARCPDFDLAALVRHHRSNAYETTVLVNPDGTPAGVYVVARPLMRYVQREGYMDLKEQWLAKVIAGEHRVGAFRLIDGYSRPLRTREQLLHAARLSVQPVSQSKPARFRLESASRRSGFQCIAADAKVDPTAVVMDSIIMSGAKVGAGSIVTRSVVCAGGAVPAEARLVDEVWAAGRPGVGAIGTNGNHRRSAH